MPLRVSTTTGEIKGIFLLWKLKKISRMNIELIRHWNPRLRRCKNNHTVFISNYCPFCRIISTGRIFRVNVKLKVFKCYECGLSGKSTQTFIKRLKENISNDVEIEDEKLAMCDPKDTRLPF